MRRLVALSLLIFGIAINAFSDDTVALKIKVILIDAQLNQKPVPRYALKVQRPGEATPAYTARTGFDGVADISVAPGTYEVASIEALPFEGKEYRGPKPSRSVPPRRST